MVPSWNIPQVNMIVSSRLLMLVTFDPSGYEGYYYMDHNTVENHCQ